MPVVGPLGHATRVIAGAWCSSSVVFVYLYSGCLTSYLTAPRAYLLIESLEDLAFGGSGLRLAIVKYTHRETIFLVKSFGRFKTLFRQDRSRTKFSYNIFFER